MQQPTGSQRAGNEHGSVPDADQAARPDAPAPSSQRPGEHAGPIGSDGAQHPPTDRASDPAETERERHGDVAPPSGETDPRVSSVPLDTEDGGHVVISQQNAGPGQQVGAGEFKEPGTATRHKSPEQAEREQRSLDEAAPTDAGGDVTRVDPGSVTRSEPRR